MSTVLIVGAGIAGLACARELIARGHAVTVVNKGRGVGGRLATRRIGEASFDTGAQFISARDPAFAAVLGAAGAVPWSDGFPALTALGPADAKDGFPRWRMPGGMNRLAKHLALGLDVRDQRTVTGLAIDGAGWQVVVEPGDLVKTGAQASGPAENLHADAVVLTAPAPHAVALLDRSGLPVPAAVRAVRYDPCLCLLLDFPTAEPLLTLPGGLRIEDHAAIGWIASQRRKALRTVGEGLVVHARGPWSAERYAWSDERILAELLPAARALLARFGVVAEPTTVQLKKWKFSLPTVTVPEPCVRIAAPVPLILAGDAYGDRPRVEGAWLSGMAAAASL